MLTLIKAFAEEFVEMAICDPLVKDLPRMSTFVVIMDHLLGTMGNLLMVEVLPIVVTHAPKAFAILLLKMLLKIGL